MNRVVLVRAASETVVVLSFVVSIFAQAKFSTPAATDEVLEGLSYNDTFYGNGSTQLADDVVSVIQQPVNGALWALVVIVGLAALGMLYLRSRERFAAPIRLSLTLGLVAATLWPIVVETSAVSGLLLAAVAPIGVLSNVFNDLKQRERADNPLLYWEDMLVCIIAAWLVVGGFSAIGLLLSLKFGIPVQTAQLIGLLLSCASAVWIQLALGTRISFALTMIWAMIGIAAASLDGSMTIATACVLGIAAMAVVCVRVTT